MPFEEKRYAGSVARISLTLLFFLLLMLARGIFMALLPSLLPTLSGFGEELLEEIVGAFLYAVCFLLPAWAFSHWPGTTPAVPLDLSLSMPRGAVRYVFFGIAVTGAMAFFNAQIVGIFHYSEFSNEVLWPSEVTANYQIPLMVLGTVAVPAFVEELLFRGVILSNLLPYGKGTAVLGSAVLFGLMHQNAEQLLYATAAGAVLGWIFVQTRSLWPCVLMHFLNNFHSVLKTVLISRIPAASTELALYLLQAALLVLGLMCGVWLFCERKDKAAEPSAAMERDDACALPLARRVKLFFNVPMIIYVAWCAANMLLLILLSLAAY